MKKTLAFQWEHQAFDNNYKDMGCTGYTGWDAHRVVQNRILPAWRAQVGPRGMYKAGLAVLPDGRLLASPVSMLAPKVKSPFPTGCVDLTYPVQMYESSDSGTSWHPYEHTPLVGKEGSLHCLPNGLLLFTSESLDGVCVSEDQGRTWVAHPFESPRQSKFEIVAPTRSPIVHGDGTLSFMRCVGTSEESWSQVKNPDHCRAWLIHSTDGGRTWKDRTDVKMDWDDPFPLFFESDFARLPDGRILAASRFEWNQVLEGKPLPYPPGSMPNDHSAGHMVLVESTDEGRSWSAPREFLNYSEVQGQLTLLRSGQLLCTYTIYHHPFGVAAVVSNDHGKTWDHDHPFQLAWSNGGSTGWATTRQLNNDQLITIHALEPYDIEPVLSGRTVCHSVRWMLPSECNEKTQPA